MTNMPDYLTRQEDLHPDLMPFVENGEWPMLRHPLVYAVPYFPQWNAMLNQQYSHKMEALEQAEREQNWSSYIWLHERPYRLQAFLTAMPDMTDADYWSLLHEVWVDSENIRQNAEVWETLLLSNRPERERFMSAEEHEAMVALPDPIPVFQGHTLDRDDGWSWTTDENVAVWFARRFGMLEDATPVVTVGTMPKSAVVGYLLSRSESEILGDPEEVTITRVYNPGEPS